MLDDDDDDEIDDEDEVDEYFLFDEQVGGGGCGLSYLRPFGCSAAHQSHMTCLIFENRLVVF